MLVKTLRMTIKADLETAWNVLGQAVEDCSRFMPGVLETRIVQREPDFLVRETRLETMTLAERVTMIEKERAIRREVLDHPDYSGTIVTRLLPTSVQNPMAPLVMEVDMKLEVKERHREGTVSAEEELTLLLTGEMDRVRKRAEEGGDQLPRRPDNFLS